MEKSGIYTIPNFEPPKSSDPADYDVWVDAQGALVEITDDFTDETEAALEDQLLQLYNDRSYQVFANYTIFCEDRHMMGRVHYVEGGTEEEVDAAKMRWYEEMSQ